MTSFCKPEKDGVEHQNEGDPKSSDNDEMKFFVGEAVLALVVQGQNICMDACDERNNVIQK